MLDSRTSGSALIAQRIEISKNIRADMAKLIRNTVEDQTELWQMIPYLAFLIDRAQGNTTYSLAWRLGRWLLTSTGPNIHRQLHIDCANGTIWDGDELASDERVIKLQDHFHEIDATKIMGDLIDRFHSIILDRGAYGALELTETQRAYTAPEVPFVRS